MRTGSAIALVTLIASLAGAVASCGEGGTGVGTAPPQSPGCPDAGIPTPGSTCNALQVCDYPIEQKVAVCPFAGGTWEVHERGEAGPFADAEIPETDAGDTGDAIVEDADALDAEETIDAEDAADTTDAADAADAIDAAETTDAAETSDATDTATTDTASDGG